MLELCSLWDRVAVISILYIAADLPLSLSYPPHTHSLSCSLLAPSHSSLAHFFSSPLPLPCLYSSLPSYCPPSIPLFFLLFFYLLLSPPNSFISSTPLYPPTLSPHSSLPPTPLFPHTVFIRLLSSPLSPSYLVSAPPPLPNTSFQLQSSEN